MTPVILDIVHQARLLKKACELHTLEVWRENREQCNKTVNRSIRRAKSRFFHDSLENSRDSWGFWKTRKNTMGSTEKPSIAGITTGDHILHNPVNNFFVSVASKYQLLNEVDLDLTALKEFVHGKISSATTLDIPKITHSSVFKQLSHLLPTKTTGLDGISALLLRAAAPMITEPLVKILNLCLSKRSLPYFMETCKSYVHVQGGQS